MSDIFKSSLEKPPKIRALLQLMKNLRKNTISLSVQRINFVAKLGKVKRTLLFAVLLNDEDENRQIDLAWIPLRQVVLASLPHMNNNSLDNIDIYLRGLVSTKLSTPINKSLGYQ